MRRYRYELFRNIPDNTLAKSGVSALASYTMLADDRCPTFAVNQEQLRSLDLKSTDMTSKDETPACMLQVHRYLIEQNGVVDPISAILSVSKDDADDARVEQAIEVIKNRPVGSQQGGIPCYQKMTSLRLA